MDLLVAEDDWVRREFDELVEAGWGGSPRPTRPRTTQGAHEPRRSGAAEPPHPAPTTEASNGDTRRLAAHLTRPARPRDRPDATRVRPADHRKAGRTLVCRRMAAS